MPTLINNEQITTLVEEVNAEQEDRVLGTRDIPDDYSIQEAVVSILDKGGDGPVHNEYTLELTEQVHAFLHKHIEKCMKSDKIKFANFRPQINGVKENCEKLLRNEESIIEVSKNIANNLFGIMQNNEGVESCDLATVNIATSHGPMIAILKLDYAKNFMHQIDFVDEKINIGITPVKTGLPSSNLLKAAFVKPNNNEGFQLLLIDDLRKSKESEDFNIHYWSNEFLQCTEVCNAKSNTLDFVKASEEWIRATKLESAKQSEEVRSTIREKILEEDTISIEELATDLFAEKPENASKFKEFMSSLNFEDEIVVDKPTAIKKLNKIKIKVDKTIALTIDRESYKDASKFVITENDDGSINMTIKNITSYTEN